MWLEIVTIKRELRKFIGSFIDVGACVLICFITVILCCCTGASLEGMDEIGMNLRNIVKWELSRPTRCHHLRVFLGDFDEEVGPGIRPGRVAHIAHLEDPTQDARLSIPGGVTCGEIFLERIKKSGEECVADDPVPSHSRGEFGQNFRWDQITRRET